MGYSAIKILLLRAADIGRKDSLCFADRFSCSNIEFDDFNLLGISQLHFVPTDATT